MLIGTSVCGGPPFGERVTVNSSTPPNIPGCGPPNETKLTNCVALQAPRATTDPLASNWVNEPLATTVAATGSKLPDPVTRIVLPEPSIAVFGPVKLNCMSGCWLVLLVLGTTTRTARLT